MFNLKAPLFKGGWGGSDAIKHSHRKNTLLPRGFLEDGKKCDPHMVSVWQMHWGNCHAITTMRSQPMFQNHK
jgi:hypothetical protein